MTAPLRLTVRRSAASPEGVGVVRVTLDLPADLSCVEEAVELLALHCFAGRAPTKRTTFRLRVTLAEALANAMTATQSDDESRRVHVAVELHAECVRVAVSHHGDGFDPASLPDPTLPDTLERECGRGVFLIRNLADQVEFNDQGNTIWMTLPRC